MTTVQILKDLGEQMGLKGTELRDFIKEQQDLEIEERSQQQREHDRIQHDKLDKFRLAQMERKKEKEQREREEQDKQRGSEKEQRKREREKEQHEIERMKFERGKMDFELQMKVTEVKKAISVISDDEEGEDNKDGSVASGHIRQRIGTKGPKMPCFDKTWIHSCIYLRYRQIARGGVKDSGQYICQHI